MLKPSPLQFGKFLASSFALSALAIAFGVAPEPAVAQDTSTLCHFNSGRRAGQTQDYAPMAPIAVGSACHDGQGSTGVVVSRGSGAAPDRPAIILQNTVIAPVAVFRSGALFTRQRILTGAIPGLNSQELQQKQQVIGSATASFHLEPRQLYVAGQGALWVGTAQLWSGPYPNDDHYIGYGPGETGGVNLGVSPNHTYLIDMSVYNDFTPLIGCGWEVTGPDGTKQTFTCKHGGQHLLVGYQSDNTTGEATFVVQHTGQASTLNAVDVTIK